MRVFKKQAGSHRCDVDRNQRGQVLPLGLVLMAFSIFMSIVLFNTGQLSAQKVRVTNAADSAAYSGMLWQARALNFQAYTNRAMVANQVSIAQAVSLRSWAQYGRISTENINSVLGSLPFVGAVTAAVHTAMNAAATVIEPVADALLITADAVTSALSIGQEIMYAAGAAATPGVVRDIAKANNENFKVESAYTLVGMAENSVDWLGFTEQYGQDSEAMKARAEIINNSRDPFSTRRDWKLFPFWFFSSPLTRHNVIREGETRLIYTEPSQSTGENGEQISTPGYWEWKAKDTVSMQTKIWKLFGSKRIEVPVGYAEVYANSDPSGNGSIEPCEPGSEPSFEEECPRWMDKNKLAEDFAQRGVPGLGGTASNIDMSGNYGGLKAFRDLSSFPDQEDDPRLELRVEVYTDTDKASTTSDLPDAAGAPLDAQVKTAKQELAAVAKSELYFHRPEIVIPGDYTEYANGYNPFWDVRLKALDTRERLAAVLLRASGVFSPDLGGSVPGVGDDLQSPLTDGGDNPGDSILAGTSLPAFDESMPTAPSGQSTGLSGGTGLGMFSGTGFSGTDSNNHGLNNTGLNNTGVNNTGVNNTGNPAFGIGVNDHSISAALAQSGGLSDVQSWINNDFQLDTSLMLDPFGSLMPAGADLLTDALADRFEDEVQDIIEDTAETLLSNALIGGFGQFAGSDSLSSAYSVLDANTNINVPGFDAVRQELGSAIATVDLESEAHLNEFERIRDDVAREFESARETVETEITTELSEIATQTNIFTELISPDFAGLDELAIEQIPDDVMTQLFDLGIDPTEELTRQAVDILTTELTELATEQGEVASSRLEREAQRLADIVDTRTDLFNVSPDQAEELIELMDLADTSIDPLRVTDENEEEESER